MSQIRGAVAPAQRRITSEPKQRTELDRLREGVSTGNATYALRYLLRADPDLARVARTLLEQKAPVTEPLLSAEQMTRWATRQFKPFGAALAARATAYLADHLTSDRGGKKVEWRYGVTEVPLPAASAPAASGSVLDVSAQVARYRDDASQVSMHDVSQYVEEWLPPFVREDLQRPGTELWVMEGDRTAALSRARRDGFSKAYRVDLPGAFEGNELYLAENAATGRRRWFFAQVQGSSGIATILRTAGMSDVKAPVSLVTDLALRQNTQLLGAYQQLRPYAAATSAVIGFKNGAVRDLWQRKLLSDHEGQVAAWASSLGLPGPGGTEHIGHLLTSASTQAVKGALELIANSPKAPAEASALLRRVEGPDQLSFPLAGDGQGESWDGAMLETVDAHGQHQSLAMLRTPYGETAAAFATTLKGFGVKNLGVIGTAGGLERDSQIGTIYVPSAVVDAGQQREVVDNALASHLTDGAGKAIRESAQGRTVLTPLAETDAHLASLRREGSQFVELELASLATAARGMNFSSAFVVSDVPGSGQTIESQAPGALDAAVGKVLDGMLRSFGVTDLELAPSGSAAPAPATGTPARQVRAQLDAFAGQAGLSGAQKQAFIERHLAAFVAEPPGELAAPYHLLLARGQTIGREVIGAIAAHQAFRVPGLEDTRLVPTRVLPLEASPLDALAVDLARCVAGHPPG